MEETQPFITQLFPPLPRSPANLAWQRTDKSSWLIFGSLIAAVALYR